MVGTLIKTDFITNKVKITFYLFRTNQVCISGKLNSNIDKHINIQNGVVLEEDTVWKCVFNLVYVHDNI